VSRRDADFSEISSGVCLIRSNVVYIVWGKCEKKHFGVLHTYRTHAELVANAISTNT
jgi:hypothetical protein